MSSFRATLELGGKEYDVLYSNYEFSRTTDKKGQPASSISGGRISVTIESTDDTSTIEAMLNSQFKSVEGKIVYKKSKEWTDDNMKQGLGMGSEQYNKSIKLAEKVKQGSEKQGKQMTIAGHSLGGGLATAAGAATGSKTYAFCPAGVHPNTYKMYGVQNPNTSKVHTYYSNQDFLNMASNNLSLMPKAAGERIMLNTLDNFDFTKGHDLPLLLKAIQAEEAELGRPIIANIL